MGCGASAVPKGPKGVSATRSPVANKTLLLPPVSPKAVEWQVRAARHSPVAEPGPEVADALAEDAEPAPEANDMAPVKQLLAALSAAVAAPLLPRTPVAKGKVAEDVKPVPANIRLETASDKIAEDALHAPADNTHMLRLKAKATLVKAARDGLLLPGLKALPKDGQTPQVPDKADITQMLRLKAKETLMKAARDGLLLPGLKALPKDCQTPQVSDKALSHNSVSEAAQMNEAEMSEFKEKVRNVLFKATREGSLTSTLQQMAPKRWEKKPKAEVALVPNVEATIALLGAENEMEALREQAVEALVKANTEGTLDKLLQAEVTQMVRLKAKETLVQAARDGLLLPGLKALPKDCQTAAVVSDKVAIVRGLGEAAVAIADSKPRVAAGLAIAAAAVATETQEAEPKPSVAEGLAAAARGASMGGSAAAPWLVKAAVSSANACVDSAAASGEAAH